MKQNNLNNFFILLGYILLFSFIWVRFIRERLPREIPFDLSLWWLIFLICICFSYGYMCYIFIKPPNPTKKELFTYLVIKLKPLFKPLILLNDHFFTNSLIKKTIIFFVKGLIFFSQKQFIYYDSLYKYILYFILPRSIFTLCLLYDCFILKNLTTIYTCIFLFTIPLFIKYLLYSIKRITNDYIISLEKDFLIEITSKDDSFNIDDYDTEGFLKEGIKCYLYEPSSLKYEGDDQEGFLNMQQCKYLKISDFINYQSDSLVFNCKPYNYNILLISERIDKISFEISNKKSTLSKKDCYLLVQFLIEINLFLKQIDLGQTYYVIKYVTFILSLLALICWLYVLLVSLPNFHFTSLEEVFLNKFQDNLEPFSNINIENDINYDKI